MSPAPAKASAFRRAALFLFLAVVLLSTPQAALLPLLDRDEPRFAEASREMLQSGNYIVPTFNHAPRYAKPPLIYWCQVVSYRIFGENAFAARLPSLLATAGTAVLLLTWGRQLQCEEAGLGAGLLYAFSLQTIQQGRVATADALLIFFMALTAFAGWKLIGIAEGKSFAAAERRWCLCGTVLALGFAGGFLAKGPEALLPIIPLLFFGRSHGRKVVISLVAIFLLGLLIVSLWAIPAYIETNGDYWRMGLSEGVGERMVTGMQGHGASTFGWYLLSIPLYLLLFWLSALPWSPLLITQRRKLFPGWEPDATDRYLLMNAGLIFVIFSLMVTKLPHYTLPAFPFLLLVFARRWQSVGLPAKRLVDLARLVAIFLALFGAIFIPIALANHASPSPVNELVRKAQAEHVLYPGTKFAMVDFQEPNVVWEMRRVVSSYGKIISKSDITSYFDEPDSRAVVLSTELWKQIDLNSDIDHARFKIYRVRGFNAAKGNFIDLTMLVKP